MLSLTRSLKTAVLALTLIAGGCDRQSAQQAQPGADSGAPGVIDRSHHGSLLPDLGFKDPAGKELRLTTLKGQPLLINLWATWCAPCIAELPTLDRLAATSGHTLQVIAVSQDLGEPAKIGAFVKDHGLAKLAVWLDPDNALTNHYQAQSLPTTVLYDSAGREVWRATGPRDWAAADTAKLLAEAK